MSVASMKPTPPGIFSSPSTSTSKFDMVDDIICLCQASSTVVLWGWIGGNAGKGVRTTTNNFKRRPVRETLRHATMRVTFLRTVLIHKTSLNRPMSVWAHPRSMLSSSSGPATVFSGIQPTGIPHVRKACSPKCIN